MKMVRKQTQAVRNLGNVINLPRLRLNPRGMNKFGNSFNERMNIAGGCFVYRVERTKEASPANAPILISMGLLANAWASMIR